MLMITTRPKSHFFDSAQFSNMRHPLPRAYSKNWIIYLEATTIIISVTTSD